MAGHVEQQTLNMTRNARAMKRRSTETWLPSTPARPKLQNHKRSWEPSNHNGQTVTRRRNIHQPFSNHLDSTVCHPECVSSKHPQDRTVPTGNRILPGQSAFIPLLFNAPYNLHQPCINLHQCTCHDSNKFGRHCHRAQNSEERLAGKKDTAWRYARHRRRGWPNDPGRH